MEQGYRKIKKSEIRELAQVMAECFVDYPLYGVFFPENEKKLKRVFYFFWFRLHVRRNYTYVDKEHDLVCSVKCPGDKDTSPIGLILNPLFLIPFLFIMPLKVYSLLSDFSKFDETEKIGCYDPERDVYVQAICVLKEARGNGLFFDFFRKMDNGGSLYCETHTEQNRKIYEFLGFKTLKTGDWHGVTQYVMKREAV